MTTLGKVLAFLNFLGVAGFVCLAAMVFGRQQAWKYANFRYDLLINGLPLDEKEWDKREDQPIADLVGDPKDAKQTLKELFPQGQPVNTQVMEVQRVDGVLNAELQKVQNDKVKHLALLAYYLKPLATSYDEHERLVLIRVNLADADKAKALKDTLQQGVRRALDTMKSEKDLPDMEAKGDRKKRPFEQAYSEGVQMQGGPPRTPFVDKMLAILPREGGKKYAEAFTGLGDPPSEEVFLREVRKDPRSFQEVFDAAYDEMLTKLDADLDLRLKGHFDEASQRTTAGSPGSTAQTVKLAPPDQKRAVARLLFNLVEVTTPPAAQQVKFSDDPGYKRVINVVGLQTLGREIQDQAGLYQSMINDLSASIAKDHNDFTVVHQDLLDQVKDRASKVASLSEEVQRSKDMAEEKDKIIARRKVDIDTYEKELDKIRKEAAVQKEALHKMSEELYKITVQVRDATRINQDYERQINALEDRVR